MKQNRIGAAHMHRDTDRQTDTHAVFSIRQGSLIEDTHIFLPKDSELTTHTHTHTHR